MEEKWVLRLTDGSEVQITKSGGFRGIDPADMVALEIHDEGAVHVVELGGGRRPIILHRVVRAMGDEGHVVAVALGFGWWVPGEDGEKVKTLCWIVPGRSGVILTDRSLSGAEVVPVESGND